MRAYRTLELKIPYAALWPYNTRQLDTWRVAMEKELARLNTAHIAAQETGSQVQALHITIWISSTARQSDEEVANLYGSILWLLCQRTPALSRATFNVELVRTYLSPQLPVQGPFDQAEFTTYVQKWIIDGGDHIIQSNRDIWLAPQQGAPGSP